MTVRQLREALEGVDPGIDVYLVWDHCSPCVAPLGAVEDGRVVTNPEFRPTVLIAYGKKIHNKGWSPPTPAAFLMRGAGRVNRESSSYVSKAAAKSRIAALEKALRDGYQKDHYGEGGDPYEACPASESAKRHPDAYNGVGLAGSCDCGKSDYDARLKELAIEVEP